MRPVAAFVLPVLLLCAAQDEIGAQNQSETSQGNPSSLSLPAGTRIELAVTAPVWARAAKPGDPFYAQTGFPVTTASSIAIPPGTFVAGTIEGITRPTRKTNRAELQVLFTRIIFANGYVLVLPDGARSPQRRLPNLPPRRTFLSRQASPTTSSSTTALRWR